MTHLIYLQSDSRLGHFRQSCQEETKPEYIKKRKKNKKKRAVESQHSCKIRRVGQKTHRKMQSRTKTPLCCNLKTLKVYYPWLWIFYFAEELLRQHWGELLSPALGPTSPFPTEVAGRWGCTEDPQAQGRSGLFLPHFEVLENSQELLEWAFFVVFHFM